MHGRLKVKTSEEQAERKKKELEKKLEIYRGAVGRIFEKKSHDELDEEMLELTGQILAKNPDFYTLWNIRRQLIDNRIDTRPREEVEKLLKKELEFLEHCFTVNPKSYGAWHQRGWAVSRMLVPDWTRELVLCTRFLQLDERNFHCWDYRRFVVKQSHVPPEEEFKFTSDKIADNFSNFSSWHYRSKLLPLVYPASGPEELRNSGCSGDASLAAGAFSSDANLAGSRSDTSSCNSAPTGVTSMDAKSSFSETPFADNSIPSRESDDSGNPENNSNANRSSTIGVNADSSARSPADASLSREENKQACSANTADNIVSPASSVKSSCDGTLNQHFTKIREDILMQELDLVENAYFTDPNDQSAWFYHRWLLGRETTLQRINFVFINPSDGRIVVSLEKPVKIGSMHSIKVFEGDVELNSKWISPSSTICDSIWTTILAGQDKALLNKTSAAVITIGLYSCVNNSKPLERLELCDEAKVKVDPVTSDTDSLCGFHWARKYDSNSRLFSRDLGAATVSTLEKQLNSCRQLHELEPDNKWVLLTLVSLMRALDPVSHLNETLDYLDKLISVDPMRYTYYLDQRSRFIMENKIEEWLINLDSSQDYSFSLTSSCLTSAYHLSRLCAAHMVDLSRNNLHMLAGAQSLQCVRLLNLSHNKIRSCRGIENLMYLAELDLSYNELEDPAELKPLLSCTSLHVVHLEGNSVIDRIKSTNTLKGETLLQVLMQLASL